MQVALLCLALLAATAQAVLTVTAVVVQSATVETSPDGARFVLSCPGGDGSARAEVLVPMPDGTVEAVALGPDWQSPERLYALAMLQRYRPSMIAFAREAPRVELRPGPRAEIVTLFF